MNVKLLARPSRVAAALLLVVFVAACAPASEQVATTTGPDTGALDTRLQAAVDDGVVRGLVAMVTDGDGVVYSGAFGFQDVASGVAMRQDTIFRMMSMTKPIASVAAMILHDEGAFGLDDPIADYLPNEESRAMVESLETGSEGILSIGMQYLETPVTIRQVFTHTSGAGYDFSSELLTRLREATGEDPGGFPLLYQPGTRWNYSVSTDRLGELVENLTGTAFDEFLHTRIFEPLNMTDSFHAVPADKLHRVATTHQRGAEGALVEIPNPATLAGPPLGRSGLYSTAPDYIRFLQMLLNDGRSPNGPLLAPETVESMRQNHIGDLTVVTQTGVDPAVARPFPINAGADQFGLGFQIAVSNNGNEDLRSPGSYSWSGLYNTHFWVDPGRGLAGVLLIQLLPFYDEQVMELYEDFEVLANQNFVN